MSCLATCSADLRVKCARCKMAASSSWSSSPSCSLSPATTYSRFTIYVHLGCFLGIALCNLNTNALEVEINIPSLFRVEMSGGHAGL